MEPLVVRFVLAVVRFWDFLTYPFYWILQRPDRKLKLFKDKRSQVEPVDANRVLVTCRPTCTSPIYEFIENESDMTVMSYMEWLARKFGSRDAMGKREILGYSEGFYKGAPIRQVSKKHYFDKISYTEVEKKYEHIARGMVKMLNLKPGQRVLIWANTRMEWMLTALGALRAGCTVVTLYTTMTKEAIIHGLKQSEPEVVVTETDLLEKLLNILDDNPELVDSKIVCLDERFKANTDRKVHAFVDIEISGRGMQVELPPVKADMAALLMYTSGTTANPKAVEFTHHQIMSSLARVSIQGSMGMGFNVVPYNFTVLCYLPLAHILEFIQELLSLGMGGCLDYGSPFTLTDQSPMVVPGEKGDLTVSKPVYFVAVPLVLCRIKTAIEKKLAEKGPIFEALVKKFIEYKIRWRKAGFTTPILDRLIFSKIKAVFGERLRLITIGGAHLPADVQQFLRAVLCNTAICSGYAATETAGCGTFQVRKTMAVDEVGFITSYNPYMLESWTEGGYHVNDPSGAAGEIIMGGYNLASGYFKHDDPYDNVAFFKDNSGQRWFRTGDIGKINPATNGLSIVDRKKQLQKLLNGEYISLSRIETAMTSNFYVETACVFAKPDKQSIVAIVVPDKDNCAKLMSSFEDVPRELEEELLSETLTIKVLKDLQSSLKHELRGYEIPQAICLVEGPWTPDTGLVTGALKIRRPAIGSKYRAEIERMFNEVA